jgi:hypothetical protein
MVSRKLDSWFGGRRYAKIEASCDLASDRAADKDMVVHGRPNVLKLL